MLRRVIISERGITEGVSWLHTETNLKHVSVTLTPNSSRGPFPARTGSRSRGGKRGARLGSQVTGSVSVLPHLESEKLFCLFFRGGGVDPRRSRLCRWVAPRETSAHRRETETQGKHLTASASGCDHRRITKYFGRAWFRPEKGGVCRTLGKATRNLPFPPRWQML